MAERICMPENLREFLLDRNALPDKIEVNNKIYALIDPVKAGEKGAVWKVKDEFSRNRALKFTIFADYEDRSYLQEVTRAAKLEEYNEFAKLIDAGISNILVGAKEEPFVCFVEEWIEGETLEGYIKNQKDRIGVSFFLCYVDFLARALKALKTNDLCHDDLHDGNIMIARPPKGFVGSEWTIKVIDMGSLKFSSQCKKEKDDHRYFVEHLVKIWNTIHGNKEKLALRDRRFLKEAINLLNTMLDVDLGIAALRDPDEIMKQFKSAYSRANSQAPSSLKLYSPFDFISAEHIADDRLLLEIFADSCPWLEKVNGPDPCLVSGPRGCGKSTIYRWLSLKAHLHKPVSDFEHIHVSGFYISCSTDFQNRLSWIDSEVLAQRFRKEITHYFNLTALREIIHTLIMIKQREDCESYWGLGRLQEERIYKFVMERFGSDREVIMRGVSVLLQLRELIEDQMFVTHTKILQGLNVTNATPQTFLGDLTALLCNLMPIFKNKKIAFLVDDFSIHRIPEPIQVILNKIIWERRPTHVFKLSSEKYGAILVDPNRATADISREMIEIDCGREFIALDDSKSQKKAVTFAMDLLDHRLKSAGYKADIEILLGHSPRESLAKCIVDRNGKGRQNPVYYGIERIAELCSGDVSHLLLVYRRICEAAHIEKDTMTTITEKTQDSCIVQVSRDLLESLKSYLPYGKWMYDIVNAFGTLVRRILEEGKCQANDVPCQCPRIEIDQTTGDVIESLGADQQKQALELIRRTVFIDMGPGLSRHKNVTTLRWNLRRIYLPAFRAALAKNDAVKEKPEWFKFFITNPKEACDMIWEGWNRQKNTPSLFPDDSGE